MFIFSHVFVPVDLPGDPVEDEDGDDGDEGVDGPEVDGGAQLGVALLLALEAGQAHVEVLGQLLRGGHDADGDEVETGEGRDLGIPLKN